MSLTYKQSINTATTSKDAELDYNPIYKVNLVINGSVDTIYVFNGKKNEREDEEELFKRIFTDEETDEIQKKKTGIVFVDQQIHSDDNIGTIKIKIVSALKNKISLDEIYLYCKQVESLNSVSVYQSLTQNKKLELTRIRVEQFVSNIISYENGSPIQMPGRSDGVYRPVPQRLERLPHGPFIRRNHQGNHCAFENLGFFFE